MPPEYWCPYGTYCCIVQFLCDIYIYRTTLIINRRFFNDIDIIVSLMILILLLSIWFRRVMDQVIIGIICVKSNISVSLQLSVVVLLILEQEDYIKYKLYTNLDNFSFIFIRKCINNIKCG